MLLRCQMRQEYLQQLRRTRDYWQYTAEKYPHNVIQKYAITHILRIYVDTDTD